MPDQPLTEAPAGEHAARGLYEEVLRCWNERNAGEFARRFSRNGNMVGFDGSPVDGRENIEEHLTQVFRSHPTAAYIGKVREVRLLSAGVVLLRAVAGMVPPGKSELNPAVNTIHTLVAASQANRWKVELFQSTPAAFHGRPAAVDALTAELRQELEQHQLRA
ncbi:MAG TPA: SgcJ/EcaC family oxidoreductase [Gemmatimonadales bacterium]|nr:SgcJ/EcaC family oxidoreductase [Gemmatimonadales bacterium]